MPLDTEFYVEYYLTERVEGFCECQHELHRDDKGRFVSLYDDSSSSACFRIGMEKCFGAQYSRQFTKKGYDFLWRFFDEVIKGKEYTFPVAHNMYNKKVLAKLSRPSRSDWDKQYLSPVSKILFLKDQNYPNWDVHITPKLLGVKGLETRTASSLFAELQKWLWKLEVETLVGFRQHSIADHLVAIARAVIMKIIDNSEYLEEEVIDLFSRPKLIDFCLYNWRHVGYMLEKESEKMAIWMALVFKLFPKEYLNRDRNRKFTEDLKVRISC